MRTNRKRLFFSLAVGLAVLASGLAYSTTAPTEYTAVATARLPGLPAAGGDPSQADVDNASLYGRLNSHEYLTAALVAIDKANGRTGSDAQAARRGALAAALRTRWHVAGGDDGSGEQRQLSVIYTGSDPHSAARTVNAVARFIAGEHADTLVEESLNNYSAARSAATATKQQLDGVRRALDDAIAAHLEKVTAADAEPDPSAPAISQDLPGVARFPPVDKTSQPSDRPDSRPRDNPVWTDLSEQLSYSEAELEQLLEKKTQAHPQVEVSQWRIAQIRRLLARTPRYLPDGSADTGVDQSPVMSAPHERIDDGESDSRVTQGQPDTAPSALAVAPAKPASRSAETAAFVKLRHQQLKTAVLKHAESDAAGRTAWEQYVTAKATATGNVRPAMAAELVGRSAATMIVLGTCIASLVAAGCVALILSPRNHVLNTVEDARKHLSVPVVGVLSTA